MRVLFELISMFHLSINSPRYFYIICFRLKLFTISILHHFAFIAETHPIPYASPSKPQAMGYQLVNKNILFRTVHINSNLKYIY